jgi:sulfur carrier protein
MNGEAGAVRISVNGEAREVSAETRVVDLLRTLGISTPRVAVEYNREILPKPRYGETVLREGDAVEIVQFVGGG